MRYKVEMFLTTEEDFPKEPLDFLKWLVNGEIVKFVADMSVHTARVIWDESPNENR